MTLVGFNKDLEHGQLVIKTLTEREYADNPDAADCGNDFGYWLTRYHKPNREFTPLAKFVNQEAVDALAEGLGQNIVYWPEED